MDDPTKDTIPRSAVEYCLRKETVSTNPEKYKTHEKFIDYMNDPDISEFGHWMHSNGFNCALTAISVDLKKIPSVPAKRGQWKYLSSTYNRDGWESNIYECSCCHGKIQIRYYIDRNDHVSKHEKFCKHCGADMRIKEGENPTGAAYGTQTDKA